MKRGVFVFGAPLITGSSGLFYGDSCYVQAMNLWSSVLDQLVIVARQRPGDGVQMRLPRVTGARVRVGIDLPDYGVGGIEGWFSFVNLLFRRAYRRELEQILMGARFVCIEAPSIEGAWAAQLAQKRGIPVVMQMRGETSLKVEYMRLRFGMKGSAYATVMMRLLNYVRSRASAGLYVSEELMNKYPVAGSLRKAIPNVELHDEVFVTPREFKTTPRVFLYVGHLEKVKCVDLIVRATHLASESLPPDWELVIVGDGPERTTLEKLASNLGSANHVKFVGRISRQEVFEWYRRADVLLMASLTEGVSRALLEAMACGLPVVSTPVGIAASLLSKEAQVTVNDIEGYARKLSDLASTTSTLTRLGATNFRLAQAFRLSQLTIERTAFMNQVLTMEFRECAE